MGEDGEGDSISERSTSKGLVSDRGMVVSVSSKRRLGGKRSFVRATAMILAGTLLLGGLMAALSVSNRDHDMTFAADPLFVAHSPIMIESESELTLAHGVTSGSGTTSDPYIIEGWEIDASASAVAGIAVANISSSLLIRDVFVHSGGSNSAGIVVQNFTDCVIERSQLVDNYVGIGAFACDLLKAVNNTISGSETAGMMLISSNGTVVEHNLIIGNPGIGLAVAMSDSAQIDNNTITGNSGPGLGLIDTNDTTVTNNVMEANQIGFEGLQDNLTVMRNNQILNNSESGIFGMLSTNSTIESNTVAYTDPGISVTMTFCSDNYIIGNNFISVISPQANDDSITDHWNDSSGGNYWSDHTGPDGDMDGFVDTAYVIPTAASDLLPRTTPVSLADWPIAVFTVLPRSGTDSTAFNFNATLSRDPVHATSALEVRWDFDGDGTWDTDFSTDKIAQHVYAAEGAYNATMELRDGSGHSANFTVHVEVEQVVIPEFPGAVVPIVGLMAMFAVLRMVRKK